MAKLLVSEKDYICKHITDKLDKSIEEKIKSLKAYMEKKIKNLTPTAILDVATKYPSAINRYSISTNSCEALRELFNYSIYIHAYYIPFDNLNFSELFDSDLKIIDLTKEIINLKKKSKEIFNKTKCALEHITTHKRLKEQFPEAYAILIEEDVNKNECDSIESLRAELNSVNKS